jgi:hypothetical protein
MRLLPITLPEIPSRLSAGVFILNSGLGKRGADEETATGVHGFATGSYPFLKSVPPQQFVRGLAATEIAVGSALLAPFVPTAVAGALLTAFSGGLLGLYLRTPGMRKPGSLAPTQEGLVLAKDSWLVGIGLGLLAHGLMDRRPRVSMRTAERMAHRQARMAVREARRSRKR